MRFRVSADGQDQLNLRELCEQHVNNLWIPDHLLPNEAKEFALDHFKRSVVAELEVIAVEVEDS